MNNQYHLNDVQIFNKDKRDKPAGFFSLSETLLSSLTNTLKIPDRMISWCDRSASDKTWCTKGGISCKSNRSIWCSIFFNKDASSSEDIGTSLNMKNDWAHYKISNHKYSSRTRDYLNMFARWMMLFLDHFPEHMVFIIFFLYSNPGIEPWPESRWISRCCSTHIITCSKGKNSGWPRVFMWELIKI